MSKSPDTITISILPNVTRTVPDAGTWIVDAIKTEVRLWSDPVSYPDGDGRKLFVYSSQTGTNLTLEITAAERLPIAVIDDQTLLNTLAAAAMERGVPMQQLIKELAKELM